MAAVRSHTPAVQFYPLLGALKLDRLWCVYSALHVPQDGSCPISWCNDASGCLEVVASRTPGRAQDCWVSDISLGVENLLHGLVVPCETGRFATASSP